MKKGLPSILIISLWFFIYKLCQNSVTQPKSNHLAEEYKYEVKPSLDDSLQVINVDSLQKIIVKDRSNNIFFTQLSDEDKTLYLYPSISFDKFYKDEIDSIFSKFYLKYKLQYVKNFERIAVLDTNKDSLSSQTYQSKLIWTAMRKNGSVFKSADIENKSIKKMF